MKFWDNPAAKAMILWLAAFVAFLVFAVVLHGCANPEQQAAKAVIQQSADTCEDAGLEIVRVGKTCEEIVTNLNALVDRRTDCRAVIQKKDVIKTCEQMGVQPHGH